MPNFDPKIKSRQITIQQRTNLLRGVSAVYSYIQSMLKIDNHNFGPASQGFSVSKLVNDNDYNWIRQSNSHMFWDR